MLSRLTQCCVLAAVTLMAVSQSRMPLFAEEPTGPAFSISNSVEQLSSSDYAERRKALKKVESHLAEEDVAWIKTQDAEAQEAIATALQFNQRLTPWLLEVIKLPDAQKKEQIDLLTSKELASILGGLFSVDAEQRITGVKKLATLHTPGVDLLLAHFLHDDEITVTVATMEGVWDRPPTEEVTQGLWDVGMARQLTAALSPPVAPATPKVTFRGEPLLAPGVAGRLNIVAISTGDKRLDAKAAREVLIHQQTPLLEKLVKKSLADFVDKLKAEDDPAGFFTSFPRKYALSDSLTQLATVSQTCKFKSTLPLWVALAGVPLTNDRRLVMVMVGGPAMPYTSVRTNGLITALLLSDQNPKDYGLEEDAGTSGVWHAGNAAEEEAAVAKLQAWWKEKSSQYTVAPQ